MSLMRGRSDAACRETTTPVSEQGAAGEAEPGQPAAAAPAGGARGPQREGREHEREERRGARPEAKKQEAADRLEHAEVDQHGAEHGVEHAERTEKSAHHARDAIVAWLLLPPGRPAC